MRQRTPLTLLALLLSTAVAASAVAADTPAGDAKPDKAPRAKLDSNGDGSISRQEAAAHPRLAERFDTLDSNKDGTLSAQEWKPQHRHGRHGRKGGHQGGHMARLDADKDGRISRDEAKADPRLTERFAKLDVNGDGYLDKADHALARTQRRDAWFAKADTNKDGVLSKAEFDAAPTRERGPRAGHRHGAKPAAAVVVPTPVR